MSQKLKKIKCNLTGKVLQIYENYYDKKVKQYGNEELLIKYYVQNKIINLIKSGHSIEAIGQLFNFPVYENQIDYYKDLINFHRNDSLNCIIKDSATTFMMTDPLVKKFINNWIEYNNGN